MNGIPASPTVVPGHPPEQRSCHQRRRSPL